MSATHQPAVCYYSKSGHTRRAAELLALKTGAVLTPIEVDRYHVPLLWVMRGIWDVGRANVPAVHIDIVLSVHRPWVVVAGPIWADQLAPPALSLLRTLAGTNMPVGLLTTSGGQSEPVKCMRNCKSVLGRSLTARVNITNKIDGTDEMDEHLNAFANAVAQHAASGVA